MSDDTPTPEGSGSVPPEPDGPGFSPPTPPESSPSSAFPNGLPTPPEQQGPFPPPPDQSRRRAAHKAPTSPRRIIVPAVIAIAAIAALLVAFNSCSDPYGQNTGIVTPAVTATTTASPSPTPTGTTSPSPSLSPTRSSSPSPTATRSASPTPTPSKTAKPTTTPKPTTAPKLPVAVRNGTTIRGLAAAFAVQVRGAGWTVTSIGNWTGARVSITTIYYPAGKKSSAQRLAQELSGSQVIAPAPAGSSSANLTVVVVR
jgi:hypothetical protein